jgi:uncharacterized integral membrane protein
VREVSYFEFLARWYNLPFVAAILAGFVAGLVARGGRRRATVLTTGLVATGVVGLTWNGALHDLGIDGYGDWFGLVLLGSGIAGALIGMATDRARRRLFPAVEGLAFTVPGLEGSEARIVSRGGTSDPGSGRAQWRDDDGILHLVRVHGEAGTIRFGRPVRLAEFDEEARSYRVEEI